MTVWHCAWCNHYSLGCRCTMCHRERPGPMRRVLYRLLEGIGLLGWLACVVGLLAAGR